MLRFKHLPATFERWNTVYSTAIDIQMQNNNSALELDLFSLEESDRLLNVILPVITSIV
jgi:hypothetical protein